jgi:photosystem II stability/assembly factor-like uncharacterized protein
MMKSPNQPVSWLILFAAISAPFAQWVQPSQQINAGIYSLLARDGELYAGTDGEGAFRSSDRGDTWETINNGFPKPAGVYTYLGFAGRLFAGTYDGVYYSNDNGKNWTPSSHENWRVLHVAALAVNGKFLFATSNQEPLYPFTGGMLRSADSGLTWTPVNTGFTAQIMINTLAQHNSALYVGTSGEGAFRSTDNGESWTPFNKGFLEGSESNARFFYSQGDKLYAGTGSGVYVLPPGKESWTRISKGLENPMLVTSIVAYGNHLFAGANMELSGGVYHSADGGASWRLVSNANGSGPLLVTSLTVLGDELFASTGESVCGELGCAGSLGGVWRVSLPKLLGTTALGPRAPDTRETAWQKMAVPGEKIGFEIGSRSRVTLKAHDAAGNLVSSLMDQELVPGKHSVPFEPAGRAKGPFFIQFRARLLNGN